MTDLIERLRAYKTDGPWYGFPINPDGPEAADALAAQAAEIERLTKEIGDLEEEGCRRDDECAKAEARADALAAALEPFRDMAELLSVETGGFADDAALHLTPDFPTFFTGLTFGDFRRVLAALHPKAPAPAGEGGAS